jgi:hypothetical protein
VQRFDLFARREEFLISDGRLFKPRISLMGTDGPHAISVFGSDWNASRVTHEGPKQTKEHGATDAFTSSCRGDIRAHPSDPRLHLVWFRFRRPESPW